MAFITRKRLARLGFGITALITAASAVAGCGSGDHGHGDHTGARVVAASSWEAAFAKAAGATDVTVIVPAAIEHAPDYDPKPSDLVAVSRADFVLYAPFEGFAGKIKDAAGSSARMVSVNLDNSHDNVLSEVRRLGDMFGTRPAADTWLRDFDTVYGTLSADLRAAWRNTQPPTVIAQSFLGFAAQMSGARVLGTYGPGEVTAKQVAELSGLRPQFVFANAQMDTGTVLSGAGARQLDLSNYPTANDDLLTVYRDTAATIIAALRG
ncbi:metal ABC transporter substrate-binding protein [Nocardia spumae]|uniref:metal ABC transporter substrate-binding protein n=1 Tax=Nocardia spumae TaxID=2887190 RepID=UPI001D1390D4|nr:metal ABC transporter substrate-binding protein [Nocardia spumae]